MCIVLNTAALLHNYSDLIDSNLFCKLKAMAVFKLPIVHVPPDMHDYFIDKCFMFIMNSPSLSIIETVALAGLTSVTPYGRETGSIETLMFRCFPICDHRSLEHQMK